MTISCLWAIGYIIHLLQISLNQIMINPALKRMHCGKRKLICMNPKCCDNRNEKIENHSIETYYEKYFVENSYEMGKKRCFSVEIRQILGATFCIGFGVVWYLFRMDYEVNAVLPLNGSIWILEPSTFPVIMRVLFEGRYESEK